MPKVWLLVAAAGLCLLQATGGCVRETVREVTVNAGAAALADEAFLRVKTGITTRAELAKTFGEPTAVTLLADGGERWTYDYETRESRDFRVVPFFAKSSRITKLTRFTFDIADGVVVKASAQRLP